MSETKKDDSEYLHWISVLKTYCCGCFTDDNIEVPHTNASSVTTENDNMSDTILVLENTKGLSENVIDDDFITINGTDAAGANEIDTNETGANETGATSLPQKVDEAEESITKIEDKIIEPNDNYF
jgi:hypothetical protein